MKILVIGMADSVHLSRWLAQFKDSEHEFRIVSSSPHRRIHPQLKELMELPNYSMSWLSRVLSLPLWILDRFASDRLRGLLVAMQASNFQPDLVHVLEFQNGGYAYLRATQFSKAIGRAKLLLTPYGSDIYWYQNEPSHLNRLKKLLALANGISSECRRDEVLAKKYGFAGALMPRVPAFGTVALLSPESDRSIRTAIAVKGYQNKWGQALLALQALESIADSLVGYEIILYSCNNETLRAARGFAQRTGLTVTAHGKGKLPNSEVLTIFQRSALYIGLSTSDGISASMIEAMANGAIPIQSDSSCCGEWLEDGVGGHLVKYHDVDRVSSLVLEILANKDWQHRAALANYDRLNLLLEPTATIRAAHETYELMAKI